MLAYPYSIALPFHVICFDSDFKMVDTDFAYVQHRNARLKQLLRRGSHTAFESLSISVQSSIIHLQINFYNVGI